MEMNMQRWRVFYDCFLAARARLLQFHGDHGTKEGGEGVITAALGLGGVGIVVRRRLGKQRRLRVGRAGELLLEAYPISGELCAEMFCHFAFGFRQRGEFVRRELAGFQEREGTAVRLAKTFHIGEFSTFRRILLEVAEEVHHIGFLHAGVENCASFRTVLLLTEDSAIFGILAV